MRDLPGCAVNAAAAVPPGFALPHSLPRPCLTGWGGIRIKHLEGGGAFVRVPGTG